MWLRIRNMMLYSTFVFLLRLYTDFRTSSSAEKRSILVVTMMLSHCFLLMIAAFFSPSKNVVSIIGVGKSFMKLVAVWLNLVSVFLFV